MCQQGYVVVGGFVEVEIEVDQQVFFCDVCYFGSEQVLYQEVVYFGDYIVVVWIGLYVVWFVLYVYQYYWYVGFRGGVQCFFLMQVEDVVDYVGVSGYGCMYYFWFEGVDIDWYVGLDCQLFDYWNYLVQFFFD